MRCAGALALAFVACSTKRAQPPPPVVDAAPALDAAPTLDAAPALDAAPSLDAAPEAATDAAVVTTEVADPFGVAKTATRAGCSALAGNVAKKDLETSYVDGNDLLALVNRSPVGALSPDFAPSDLVDIRSGKAQTASDCEKTQCLRKDAAAALDEILAAMKKEGFPGHVESAFRSYGMQCGTFGNWAAKSSFCEATEQSAIPGHSQHQLGTTVDLFTEEWAKHPKGVFREGFGCTPPGRWIREHATEFGFVMPYPIHPDDRHKKQKCTARWDIPVGINPKTGYRFEHWHIRYVGKEAAARFKAAFEASVAAGPAGGGPNELAVEQWLRAEKGLKNGDVELPTCDTCNCSACGTLAAPGESTCDKRGGALHLDEHGKPRPLAETAIPVIREIGLAKKHTSTNKVVEVKLEVPAGTITQPPITGRDAAAYTPGATFEKLAPYPETDPRAFPPLPGAWVVAVEPVPNDTGTAWPFRASLSAVANGALYNKANVVLPAHPGAMTLRIPIPATYAKAKVVLMKGGSPQGQERAADLD